uniref:KIF-binding protein n=1 Tax=Cyclophora tenuis TaxID=216820 RepID=A0A7S1D428_CYCTE
MQPSSCSSGSTHKEQPYYCSIQFCALLYNFALTNHIFALETGQLSSVSKLPYKALALYNMALTLIKVEGNYYDESPTCTSMAVAILNNMGQIQQELGIFDSAQTSFNMLLKEWLSLPAKNNSSSSSNNNNNSNTDDDGSDDDPAHWFMSESERKGVTMNLFLYSQTFHTAPAA